jgi:hypothetical protein
LRGTAYRLRIKSLDSTWNVNKHGHKLKYARFAGALFTE